MSIDFAHYDSRKYRTLDVREGYAAWASFYEAAVDGQLDLPLLEQLKLDWGRVQRIADLACGTGRVGAWLRSSRNIRQIDGVDGSAAMLELARGKAVYGRLAEGEVTDALLGAQAYDLVLNVLAACHLPALERLYQEAARLLAPSGSFLLIDFHPNFFVRGIPTHFELPAGETVAIRNYVHHFSDHIQAGHAAKLELADLRERFIDEAWVTRSENLRKHLHQPVGFGMVWTKSRGS